MGTIMSGDNWQNLQNTWSKVLQGGMFSRFPGASPELEELIKKLAEKEEKKDAS